MPKLPKVIGGKYKIERMLSGNPEKIYTVYQGKNILNGDQVLIKVVRKMLFDVFMCKGKS